MSGKMYAEYLQGAPNSEVETLTISIKRPASIKGVRHRVGDEVFLYAYDPEENEHIVKYDKPRAELTASTAIGDAMKAKLGELGFSCKVMKPSNSVDCRAIGLKGFDERTLAVFLTLIGNVDTPKTYKQYDEGAGEKIANIAWKKAEAKSAEIKDRMAYDIGSIDWQKVL